MPFKSKEEQKEYLKNYRKKNRNPLLNRRKRRVICACGSVCSWNSLGKHRDSKKHTTYETKQGGQPIKTYEEIEQLEFMNEEVEETEKEVAETEKEIAEVKPEKPIWKQFCKKCGNSIESHSVKRLISCGLVENKEMIDFLNTKIKN
jgi:CxxC motif-containing protein